MWEYTLLRGKVTAHLDDEKKGLVEVSLGGYDKDGDKLHARVEQNMAGIYWLPEIGDVVEVFVPDSPGYEAHVLRVRRREGDEQAAECWTETNDRKQIKTRSGHTITLDDTQDKTSLMIQIAGGLQHAGWLASVFVKGLVILLGGPCLGQGVRGPAEHRNAF